MFSFAYKCNGQFVCCASYHVREIIVFTSDIFMYIQIKSLCNKKRFGENLSPSKVFEGTDPPFEYKRGLPMGVPKVEIQS